MDLSPTDLEALNKYGNRVCRFIKPNESTSDYALALAAERKARKFIREEVRGVQTSMIEDLIDNGCIDLEDADNLYRDLSDNDQTRKVVYEWWFVSEFLGAALAEKGYVRLEAYSCNFWGRGFCGQNMLADGTLQEIAAMYTDEDHVRDLINDIQAGIPLDR